MVKVCALQMPTLSMSESRIEYYLKQISPLKPDVILFGEYVLNNFLTELIKLPKNSIIEQSDHKISLLKRLSAELNTIIIAPLIVHKKDGFYKVIAKFSPKSFRYEMQNFLMDYSHWNERKFFKNANTYIKILKFKVSNIKFACVFGFDAHFDKIWNTIHNQKIDCVLIPTASTFNSYVRWDELLKTRAFLNSTYILRANRVGKAKFGDNIYNFYGQSMLISPYSEILNRLDENEDFFVAEISSKISKDAKKLWHFEQISKKII